MIYFKLLFMSLFWGGAFVAGRSVSLAMGSFSAAFIRFIIATLVLGSYILVHDPKSFKKFTFKEMAGLAFLGLIGISIYNAFFFSGLRLIDAGRASALITTNPIAVYIMSVIFLREKLSVAKISGILVSVTGACIVIFKGNLQLMIQGDIGKGELYILGCVFSWAIYSILGKKILKTISPLHAVFFAIFFGSLFLLYPAIHEGLFVQIARLEAGILIALIYLALAASVLGYIWYYDGVREIGPAAASQFVNFIPVNALMLSYIIFHEPVTPSLIIGTCCVIGGVSLTNKR